MDRLGDTALIGGERTDAIDHCLAGIARLSSEVKDASASIPPYDQRIYADVRHRDQQICDFSFMCHLFKFLCRCCACFMAPSYTS